MNDNDRPDREQQPDLNAYIGRWVALVDGQIAGVGNTGTAAQKMARRNRPKRPIHVQYVPDLSGEPLTLSTLLAELAPVFAQLSVPIYLVGGAVRDAVLGRVSHDLDFVVPKHGIQTAFRLADLLDTPIYPLDKERDVGRVLWRKHNVSLDIATYRGDSLTADLTDRDFTINAMALPVLAQTTAEIIDPTGGLTDLAEQTIRQTPPQAGQSDPVRALRAIRMGIRYHSTLTAETTTAVRQTLGRLHDTSPERLRTELLNLLHDEPDQALRQLDELGGLAVLLPRIKQLEPISQSPPHHEPVLPHTLSVLRWLKPVLAERVRQDTAPYAAQLRARLEREMVDFGTGYDLLRLGALYHDVGKAKTRTIGDDGRIHFYGHDKVGAKITAARLADFRFSKEIGQYVSAIVEGHMRPLLFAQETKVSVKARHRFFRQFGAAGLDICLLSLADHLATYNGTGGTDAWQKLQLVVDDLLTHYFTHEEETVQLPPLLDGRQLMQALKIKGGPEVGRILRLVREAQIAGELHTAAEAINYARTCLN